MSFVSLNRAGTAGSLSGSDTSIRWGLCRPVYLGSCPCHLVLCVPGLSMLIDALEKVLVNVLQGLGWRAPPPGGFTSASSRGWALPTGRGPPRPRCTPEVLRPTQLRVAPGCLHLTCPCRPRCPPPGADAPQEAASWRGRGCGEARQSAPLSGAQFPCGQVGKQPSPNWGANGRVEGKTHGPWHPAGSRSETLPEGPWPRQHHVGCETGPQGWEPQGLCSLGPEGQAPTWSLHSLNALPRRRPTGLTGLSCHGL